MSKGKGAAKPAPTPSKPKQAKKVPQVKNETVRPLLVGGFMIQSGETLPVPEMVDQDKKRFDRALELGLLSIV